MGALIITNVSNPNAPVVTASLIESAPTSRTGGTSASASSGSSAWQVVTRSRRKAATEWVGYDPIVMSCTCLVDGAIFPTSPVARSVEGLISTIEAYEIPVDNSSPPLPPLLTISGPVPHTDLFWVCSKLSFAGGETGQIRNDAGERTQQGFTIEFTEYSPSTAISTSSLSPAQIAAGSAAGQTTNTGTRTYVVKAGDTLQSIAATQLANVSLWPQIALLSGLSKSARLTAGTTILLPAMV